MKRTMAIDGTELYYEIHGRGVPVLMIHGWSVDHRLMSGALEPAFRGRNRGFMRIYVDLPGMGKSKAGGSIHTSDDVLRVILAFIDAVIPGAKFLLAGESYGGDIARGLLLVRKEMVLGLFLLCPLIHPGERKGNVPEKTVLERDAKFLSTLTETERAYFTGLAVVETKRNWKRFKRDVYPALLGQDRQFLGHTLTGAFSRDINAEPFAFEGPVLVITGRQDNAVGYRDQMEKFIDCPRATLAVLDKAGHNAQIEQERLTRELVADWLDRVRSCGGR